MQCPVCATATLQDQERESGLITLRCPSCRGQWLTSAHYWAWHDQHPEQRAESSFDATGVSAATGDSRAKLCPECGRLLIRYKVGQELPFALDRCGGCGGVWFDADEWELLKARNLHHHMHCIFSYQLRWNSHHFVILGHQ